MFNRKKTETVGPRPSGPQASRKGAGDQSTPTAQRSTTDDGKTRGISPDGVPPGTGGRASRAPRTSSVLNSHLTFDGTLKYTGTLTMDCEFHGTVTTGDNLVVGPLGQVKAEIYADNVEISGKVWGDVHAKTRVKILSGGEVYGNIETPSISMDDGVIFEGQCTTAQETQTPSGPSPVSSEVQKVLGGASEVFTESQEGGSTAPGSKKEVELTS